MTEIKLRNGRTLEEALAKIGEYKEPKKYLQDKYPYYKFGEYKSRLDEAFGIGGYETVYSDYATFVLPSLENVIGQVLTKVTCTISVFGIGGEVVFKASGIGTKEISRDKEKVQYQLLNNNGLFVQQAAFKSAAKSMNIFDCNRYDEDGSNEGSTKSQQRSANENVQQGRGQNGNDSRKSNAGEKVITLYRIKPLEKIRDDRNTSLPVYRLVGHEVIGNNCRQKECEVILYPNCYKKESEKINALLTSSGGSYVTVKVSEGTCSDTELFEKTFIFKSFAAR